MKVIWWAALGAILGIVCAKLPPEKRVSGENGWYVPQSNGTLKWMDIGDNPVNMINDTQVQARLLDFVPVNFYLYTRKNPANRQQIYATKKSIKNSNFNPDDPTRIIIHGWTMGAYSNMNKKIRDAWLSRGDYNIICVDWSRARFEYVTAVLAVPKVGKKIAYMIDYLVKNFGMSLKTLTVIGHSLGAHISGYAGKHVETGKIDTIWGLDPALPLFFYDFPHSRLAETDATYVETIHTNGGLLGFLKPIGKGAFYANGGVSQPSCLREVMGACSHNLSVDYYAEAVTKNSFMTYSCESYKKAVDKDCDKGSKLVRMGQLENSKYLRGYYYVPINVKAPYGFIL